jgi:hypothetical protein
LKPIGIPPVISLTLSANALKSSGVCKSSKVGGETAGVPSFKFLTFAILPITLFPERCPPVPVFAP